MGMPSELLPWKPWIDQALTWTPQLPLILCGDRVQFADTIADYIGNVSGGDTRGLELTRTGRMNKPGDIAGILSSLRPYTVLTLRGSEWIEKIAVDSLMEGIMSLSISIELVEGEEAQVLRLNLQSFQTILCYGHPNLHEIAVMRARLDLISPEPSGTGSRTPERDSAAIGLPEAYEILDSSPADSMDLVKKKYKEQCAKYHPDKYANSPMPNDVKKFLEVKFSKVNDAYRVVMLYRKSR